MAVINNTFVMALITDDCADLLQRFGKREFFFPDGHPAWFDAAHVQNSIYNPQQMLGRGFDFSQILLHLIAGSRIIHCNVIQSDNRVHGCANLMAHIGEKRGFCLVGAFCDSQSVFQSFPAFRQLFFLFLIYLCRFLQFSAVFFLLILNYKAMQQTGTQHVPYRIQGQQRVKDLNGNQ